MPHRLSLVEMAAAIRARRLSPVEAMAAHLAQMERLEPELNAFAQPMLDEAREAAARAEETLARGEPAGPLHGVPVTVKDSFDIADRPTWCGSRYRLEHRASRDATAVRRLRAAGAILLGKTNCPEFLMNWETENAIRGRTNNPWDLERTPGGSSGGESAAIAAFCSAGGVGSDGGGSVRVPAHFCGIAGLKPTPGRVSAGGHFPEICHPGGLLGVAGPMARTVRDLQALFEVLAGYDPEDPFSAPVTPHPAPRDGVRVGLLERFPGTPVAPGCLEAVRKAAAWIESLGYPVEPFSHPGLAGAPGLWWFFFGRLNAILIRQAVDRDPAKAHWSGTELMELAEQEPVPDACETLGHLARRDKLRSSVLRAMEAAPVLLMPVCGVTAFRHRERGWETGEGRLGLLEAVRPVTVWNLLGFPALAVPIAVTEGLPAGVQLIARPWQEELLLEIGVRLEEARGPLPPPPLAAS